MTIFGKPIIWVDKPSWDIDIPVSWLKHGMINIDKQIVLVFRMYCTKVNGQHEIMLESRLDKSREIQIEIVNGGIAEAMRMASSKKTILDIIALKLKLDPKFIRFGGYVIIDNTEHEVLCQGGVWYHDKLILTNEDVKQYG